jgi:hypothetical protein
VNVFFLRHILALEGKEDSINDPDKDTDISQMLFCSTADPLASTGFRVIV